MPYARRLAFLLLASGLTVTFAARPAAADCTPPLFRLAWTYPGNGYSEIPTNAVLWVLASRQAKVTVNGEAATPGPLPSSFQLTEGFAPLTEYEVVVTAAAPEASDQPLTFHFKTGKGPVASFTPPAIDDVNVRRVSDRPFGAYSICNAVFYAEECFDTGPNEHVIFETLPARPLVWIVEKLPHSPGEETATKVWPGVCDEPEMYVHAPSDSCYDLIAANELGLMTRSRRICPGAAGGGCALGGAAHGSLLGPAFGLLALAGALRIRHLRRRGQRDTDQRRQRPASHP